MSTRTAILIPFITILMAIIAGSILHWPKHQDLSSERKRVSTQSLLANPAAPQPRSPQANAQRDKLEKIRQLAQHHCSHLSPAALAARCESKTIKDLSAGNSTPEKPELDPNHCATINNPNEQHKCHGWLGHNFAVSTKDIGRCSIIPQKDIRESCQLTITVNEIKALYVLDFPDSVETTLND